MRDTAGGSAFVHGVSSGAALALNAKATKPGLSHEYIPVLIVRDHTRVQVHPIPLPMILARTRAAAHVALHRASFGQDWG